MRTFSHVVVKWLGLLAALGLCLSSCGGGVAADRNGNGDSEPAACRSAPGSELDEFGGAIAVSASLSRPPAVAETAALSARIEAAGAYQRAEIVIELPPGMEFVGTVPGMSVSRGLSLGGQATVERARGTQRLEPGSPVVVRATVRATAAGSGQVRLRVTAPTAGGVDAGSAEIFVTVGASPAESACRIDVPPVGNVTTVAAPVG